MVLQADKMKAQGWITAVEAAERLGLHVASVYRLAEKGELEEIKIGSSHYIKAASLIPYANKFDSRGAELLGLVPPDKKPRKAG